MQQLAAPEEELSVQQLAATEERLSVQQLAAPEEEVDNIAHMVWISSSSASWFWNACQHILCRS